MLWITIWRNNPVGGSKGERLFDCPDVCKDDLMEWREDSSLPFLWCWAVKVVKTPVQVSKVHIIYPGYIWVAEDGKKRRHLFWSRCRSIYIIPTGKNSGILRARSLPALGSNVLKDFVFQGKHEITLLKQKLLLHTPTVRSCYQTNFISCSCDSVKHIVHQRHEEKSAAKKKTTVVAFPGSVLQPADSFL